MFLLDSSIWVQIKNVCDAKFECKVDQRVLFSTFYTWYVKVQALVALKLCHIEISSHYLQDWREGMLREDIPKLDVVACSIWCIEIENVHWTTINIKNKKLYAYFNDDSKGEYSTSQFV